MIFKSVFCVVTVLQLCEGAKILGIIPTPSYSHQLAFQPIWRELSLRGHNVTVITANPLNDPKLINLTEINISTVYDCIKRNNVWDLAANKNILFLINSFIELMRDWSEVILSHPQVQQLIKDPSFNFDLVFYEALSPVSLAFAYKYKCPAIGMASMDVPFMYHQAMGNPTHPLVSPDYNLKIEDTENMSFFDRFTAVFSDFVGNVLVRVLFTPVLNDVHKKHFGEDFPDVYDLFNLTDIIFTTTNPIFNNIRPVNPNTFTIGGGLHIQKPKPLPNDLKQYLDGANDGVIYFSLGSNVKGSLLTEQSKTAIMNVFSQLPQKVLMKCDWENITIPQNVKVEKWLPQQDLLRHPNIKLFVTQGGLQSLQEAITNGVPIVGIPFFGDQYSNVFRSVKKGFAVRLNKDDITEESFKGAVLEVLNNPKYKETAIKMGQIMYDEPMTSLEKVIWWTEYVIRHKGAQHLKSNAPRLPFYQYYLLDVIGIVLLSFLVLIYVLYKLFCVLRFLWRSVLKIFKTKQD